MQDFFAYARRFLDLKSKSDSIYKCLHYTNGRIYATQATVMAWIEDESGRRGSYDFVTSAKEDITMPQFEKAIPPVRETSVYGLLTHDGVSELLAVAKGVAMMFGKGKPAPLILEWDSDAMRIQVRRQRLDLWYETGALMQKALPGELSKKACVDARIFSDIIGYFARRKVEMRIYAPLRVARQSPILFTADGTGVVLGQLRDMTIYEA